MNYGTIFHNDSWLYEKSHKFMQIYFPTPKIRLNTNQKSEEKELYNFASLKSFSILIKQDDWLKPDIFFN